MTSSKSQMQIEGLFSPSSPWEFLGFAAVAALLELFLAGNWIGLVFVPTFAIAVFNSQC